MSTGDRGTFGHFPGDFGEFVREPPEIEGGNPFEPPGPDWRWYVLSFNGDSICNPERDVRKNVFDAFSCDNPLCKYCRGSGKPYECSGYEYGRYDNRSLRDLVEQKKPNIGFRCQFKKHFRSLIPGRNFMFLMGLLDLPWEYATEQFYRSFPSLRDDEYFSKGPHEFAWCIICIVNTLFRKK
jgi:hypothetical protein